MNISYEMWLYKLVYLFRLARNWSSVWVLINLTCLGTYQSFQISKKKKKFRVSTSTDITSVSRQHHAPAYRKRRNRRRFRQPSRASSFSSITESSMSLDVITVTLNMDTVNFLGISIVGQSSSRGDNGIYVANIMKGSWFDNIIWLVQNDNIVWFWDIYVWSEVAL